MYPLDALEAFRLANFRSLVDTGFVDVKPITLLVGANSSGKSTFLRAFPLLKQSVETATSNPILWFGRYVDFGSLENAIHHGAGGLTLAFRLDLPTKIRPYPPALFPFDQKLDVELTLVPTIRHGARVSACSLRVAAKEIALKFDEDGNAQSFTVDGKSVLPAETLRLADSAILIPSITTEPLPAGDRAIVYQPYTPSAASSFATPGWPMRRREEKNPLQEAVFDSLKTIMRRDTSRERLRETMFSLPLGPDAELLRTIDQTITHGGSRKPISQRSPGAVSRLIANLWALAVPDMLRTADGLISRFVANATYMGPLRATAQRYYRAQDLSVREVDFRGENLAMFMRSLSETEQKDLSAFTEQHFGLAVRRDDEGGHVTLSVRAPNSPAFVNLADAGFGYSQMLPLIALMWSTYGRGSRIRQREPVLVAIEQPELHLHPAHQARLADMFVSALSASQAVGGRVHLLVETHSEAIVNRMGDLVRENKVKASDVQIAIFERDEETASTNVRFAGYNEDGSLTADWPFGFFAA